MKAAALHASVGGDHRAAREAEEGRGRGEGGGDPSYYIAGWGLCGTATVAAAAAAAAVAAAARAAAAAPMRVSIYECENEL